MPKMYTEASLYRIFHLVPLPRSGKYFEIAFILFALLFALLYCSKFRRRLQPPFIVKAVVVIVVLSVISGYLNGSPRMALLQVTYVYLSPILVFLILSNLNLDKKYCAKILRLLFFLAGVNVLIGIYQVIMGYRMDSVIGLMWGAHVFANYISIMLLFLLAYIFVKRKFFLLPLGIVFIVPVIFASSQRTTLTMGIVLILLYLLTSTRGLEQRVIFLIPLIIIFVSSILLIQRIDIGTSTRAKFVIENLSSVGITRGYLQLPSVFMRRPEILLIGCGPGNPIPYTPDLYVPGEGYLLRYMGRIDFGIGGAYNWVASLLVYVLLELGLPALIFFIIIFKRVFSFLLWLFKNAYSEQLSWRTLGLILYFTFLVLLVAESPYANYTHLSLTWPFFGMLGILYSNFHGRNQLSQNSL